MDAVLRPLTGGPPPAVGPRVRAPREHVDDRGAVEARERPVGLEDAVLRRIALTPANLARARVSRGTD